MEYHTGITSLFQIHFKFYIGQYIEAVLLIFAFIKFKRLKEFNLGGLIYLAIGLIITDILIKNSSLAGIISTAHLLEFSVLLFGLMIYPGLKKEKLAILVPTIAFVSFTDTMQWIYAAKGWYNLFIINYFYVFSAPFFYVLFYSMLRTVRVKTKIYLFIATISEIFFLYGYFTGDNSQINNLTSSIFYLQHIVIGGIIIWKMATHEFSVALIKEPFFWVCAGRIILSLIDICLDGLHSYLVNNYIEIYRSAFLENVQPLAGVFLTFCYFYAFFLCAKRSPERLSFSFLRQEIGHA
jgi:hypothetical protein